MWPLTKKKTKMFLNGIFNFSEPLCRCDTENLSWTILSDYSLIVTCKICQTSLHIPVNEFKMGFNFEKPYPKKKETPNGNGKLLLFKNNETK